MTPYRINFILREFFSAGFGQTRKLIGDYALTLRERLFIGDLLIA
jgi:hypothetical protein